MAPHARDGKGWAALAAAAHERPGRRRRQRLVLALLLLLLLLLLLCGQRSPAFSTECVWCREALGP